MVEVRVKVAGSRDSDIDHTEAGAAERLEEHARVVAVLGAGAFLAGDQQHGNGGQAGGKWIGEFTAQNTADKSAWMESGCHPGARSLTVA